MVFCVVMEQTELDFEPPPAKTRKKEHAKSSTKERKLKKSYKNKKVHKNK